MSFADLRLHREGTSTGLTVTDGGAVEVLPDATEAGDRAYDLRMTEAVHGEYDYVFGAIILRLSPRLTHEQAMRYRRDLYRIPGARSS